MKYENAIYVENKNFIFLYIPKVACTNWKSIFRYMQGEIDYLNPQKAHSRTESGLVFLSSLKNKKDLLRDDKIKKYTFIRNPFTRILSAYLNKCSEEAYNQPYFKAIQDELRFYQKNILKSNLASTRIEFFTFLHWLKYSDSEYINNEHWIPQIDIIGEDLLIYNYVGRFENLAIDSQIILDAVDCKILFPTQEEVNFMPTNASDKILNYYRQKEINLVLDIFQKDFELLGYSTKIEDI